MEKCPCGGAKPYSECCGLFHRGDAAPQTPEALMRSRYSAYVKSEIEYLVKTLRPEDRSPGVAESAREWADSAEWLGLEILKVYGAEKDEKGQVEFIARYRMGGVEHEHHEISRFKKLGGVWYFANGKVIPSVPKGVVVSRNAPCPCGSGKKFKLCCGGE